MMPFLPAPRETTVEALAHLIETGGPVQVVDVRPPATVASGRIEGISEKRFHNVTTMQLMTRRRGAIAALDPGVFTAVVCNRGNESKMAAALLEKLGVEAASVQGGMAAWMRLVVPREVAPPPGVDRVVQFDRVGKGALGYLVASRGEAVLIDPPRDAAAYLSALGSAGARLVGVVDTHVHADYVSGGPHLASQYGVPYYLHPADAVYPYDGRPGRITYAPLNHGDDIPVGACRLRAWHTPGHTLGSTTLVVSDEMAFTGDFLFVNSIGRPDLAGHTAEWAADLWRSVEAVKREWPAAMQVYPAHYSAESERRADRVVGTTFGSLLERLVALRFERADPFIAWVLEREAAFPEVYRQIKAINIGLASVSEEEAEVLEMGRNECALGGSAGR
ncbi:MAG: MBL fold metallo-hydrolase [Gemmatimonadota bacterium]|nr:MBL fold metallo-hydrolase [Gemmatimonadota bacterium]MDH5283725.1 MBL fold metallo-hydrolase [Gemmatimonadota bacterium]